MIIRVDGNLTDQECSTLCRIFDENNRRGSGHDNVGWPLIQYHDGLFGDAIGIVHKALHGAIAEIERRLEVTGQYPEQIILAGTGKGGHHPPHADNCRLNSKGEWEPNHTPNRTYTCMQYLNSEFEGGVLRFPDRDVAMRPKAGMLIAFPSDREHVHEVTMVTSGFRYSLAMWLTDNKKHALHLG